MNGRLLDAVVVGGANVPFLVRGNSLPEPGYLLQIPVPEVGMLELHRTAKLVEVGRRTAEQALPELRSALARPVPVGRRLRRSLTTLPLVTMENLGWQRASRCEKEGTMAQYTVYRPGAATPWSAFDQLRREMDDLLSRFNGAQAWSGDWRGVFPAVNLYETADAYQLTAELPGVEPEEIRVSLEGSTVILEGERKIDYASRKETSLHRRERQAGAFRRAFELPAAVNGEKVEAVHRNGVLMLRLPKTPEAQPRQISVRGS